MNTQLQLIQSQLSQKLPLVPEEEIQTLGYLLGKVSQCPEDYFILQIGDCAERFEDSTQEIVFKKCQFYSDMAQKLELLTQKKVVLLARMAGQYAKPRTDEFEVQNGQMLPIYKGDMINKFEFSEQARQFDPNRILKAYDAASQVLNHIQKFQALSNNLKIYTSHEALMLEYENGLTRKSQNLKDAMYNYSAHTVWLGHQSKELNGPQIEYLSTIENPIGIKLGPTQNAENFKNLLQKLNPNKVAGKIYLITRFGLNHIKKLLPQFIDIVQQTKQPVLWCVDPMHGNTFKLLDSRKVRAVNDIIEECRLSIQIHKQHGTVLSGLHLEASCDFVTECTVTKDEAHLHHFSKYATQCDPRLNPNQVKLVLDQFKKPSINFCIQEQNIIAQSHL